MTDVKSRGLEYVNYLTENLENVLVDAGVVGAVCVGDLVALSLGILGMREKEIVGMAERGGTRG